MAENCRSSRINSRSSRGAASPSPRPIVFALGFLPLGFGTASTVLFFVAALLAVVELARRRVPFRVPRPVGFAVVVCLAFFGIDAVSPVFYDNPGGDWRLVLQSLHFLFLPVLLLALAPVQFDPVRAYVGGVRIGAIVGGAIAVLQVVDGFARADGGMINALPFGSAAALFAFVSLIGVWDGGWRNRIVAFAAFAAGLVATFLSEARGAWLALPVLLVFAIVYCGFRYGRRVALWATVGLAAIGLAAVLFAGDSIRSRIGQTVDMFQQFEFGGANREALSLNQRAMMAAYGLEALAERPVFGYGPQNTMAEVRSRAAADGNEIASFQHLHNEYVNEAVDNGLVGLAVLLALLAAPVVVALRSAKDERRQDRLALAVFVSASTAIFGLTNIIFGHDITNTVFATGLLVVCLSAARSGGRAPP